MSFDSADWDFAGRRGCAGSTRTSAASTLVVAVDHLVTGLAGGDQETAAGFADVEHRDESGSKRGDGEVYEDEQLTVSTKSLTARPVVVGIVDTVKNSDGRTSGRNGSIRAIPAAPARVLRRRG